MNICLIGGSFDTPNRGVAALAVSAIEGFKSTGESSRVFLLDYGRDGYMDQRTIGCGDKQTRLDRILLRFSSKLGLPNNVLRLLGSAVFGRLIRGKNNASGWRKSDFVVKQALANSHLAASIAGGDSFSDIYGLRQMLYVCLPVLIMQALNCPVALLPQTYGPYRSRWSRVLARLMLRNAKIILARDKQSQAVAQSLAGAGKKVMLSPDVAFALQPMCPEFIELVPPLTGPRSRAILGLNVSGLMYNGGYTRRNMFGLKLDYPAFLLVLVKELLTKYPGEIWLIPHTFGAKGDVESDPDASHKLRDLLPPDLQARVRIVDRAYDQHEIKGVIGQCDFFIGSRMHACIAALSQGIPAVGVAYSMKFKGVFETVGMGDWVIDARDTTGDEAVRRILALLDQRDSVRSTLWSRAESARADLRAIFQGLVSDASAIHNREAALVSR